MRVAWLPRVLLVALALTALAAHQAHAAGCESEIERLCKGQKQILQCLRKNQADLSPTCTTYVGIFEQLPSCLSDANRLCPTDKPSVSSIVGCLRGKSSEVSAECKAELEKVRS